MPRALTAYVSAPWTTRALVEWLGSNASWTLVDPRRSYFESVEGARAWVGTEDSDSVSLVSRLGGFVPSAHVLFEAGIVTALGARRVVAAVLDLASRSSALLFLYESEETLLLAREGRLQDRRMSRRNPS